ncbi:LysR family transcriptional regulator [Burkholderia stabilis]|uniref:LysR substrate-binding domain-containing protein n=1 Tax=Burkholderia stabilis TaxID=95485 RepID=UPI00085169AE|nr:LysR substrate-binding domain-containing protein [Burkholderia stabilis]AOR67034.1 LysR family transcriptional regulator [Burkholderia stabilis]HDR9495687.1 LysR family transcriptional regulator [Burkholderia stabilis]HDR9525143.1 LysR family transcriptional regulator [Burkholderia stabilis]HDR9532833.1 LysR family transcriptional regulator [Burkholderia stabilis]HDR9539682.1 LysR family transcriptional regulator [Burkholderia stabilis]
MYPITDLNDLRLFAEVVEHGSFTAAARSLGAQTSKLSRRIRALEEELGVRLLNRTSRSLSLTETGRQFHQHCVALVAESRAAKDIVDRTRTQPQGTVRISCPVGLLGSGVAAIVARYIENNPQVQVLLDATNRRVDVVEEGLDFAIRVRVPPLENTDLAVRQLGVSVRILVASPALAARYPAPESIDSLKDWPTVSMAGGGDRFVWNLTDADGRATSFAHRPRLATDDLASLRIAAIGGIGVAELPRELVSADLQAGQLIRLLPALSTPPGLVHAIFPTRRGMVPAVRHLLDALVAGFEELNRIA